jgi:hypothetical protein
MTPSKRILRAKIMEAAMIGPLSELEKRIDKLLNETCFHIAIKIDGANDYCQCIHCGKKLKYGTWEEL